MAGFAEADDYMIGIIRDRIKDGLTINGTKYQIEIITKDSQTDESRTAEVASELVLGDKVDIITACSGSIDCNPVANVAELNGVPCVTADDPWESYYYGRNPPKEGFEWTYHFFWGLAEVLQSFIGLWDTQKTNKVVGTLFNTALDDNSWHDAFIPAIKAAGYTVVDPGQFRLRQRLHGPDRRLQECRRGNRHRQSVHAGLRHVLDPERQQAPSRRS